MRSPRLGSGKTFAVSECVNEARERHRANGDPAGSVVVLATTGMAVSVLDVGAMTIHSFLGVFDISSDDYQVAWAQTRNVPGVVEALVSLRVFVLDEGELIVSLPGPMALADPALSR